MFREKTISQVNIDSLPTSDYILRNLNNLEYYFEVVLKSVDYTHAVISKLHIAERFSG